MDKTTSIVIGVIVALAVVSALVYFGVIKKSPPSSGTGGGTPKSNGNIPTDQQ